MIERVALNTTTFAGSTYRVRLLLLDDTRTLKDREFGTSCASHKSGAAQNVIDGHNHRRIEKKHPEKLDGSLIAEKGGKPVVLHGRQIIPHEISSFYLYLELFEMTSGDEPALGQNGPYLTGLA